MKGSHHLTAVKSALKHNINDYDGNKNEYREFCCFFFNLFILCDSFTLNLVDSYLKP